MNKIAGWIKRIPGSTTLYRGLMRQVRQQKLRGKSPEQVFSDIFRSNGWGGTESVSGRGSTFEQTRVMIGALPELFRTNAVESVLDVPCGDFHWMSQVDLSGIDYTGADIVPALVARNAMVHARCGVRFVRLDPIHDELPRVGLIFCRDCLVHLSYADIAQALRAMARSGSRYLLTTTFTFRQSNTDIVTGEWRPLNLQAAPFNLPQPLVTLNERCTEGDGQYGDKSMALWHMSDIADRIQAA